MRVLQAPLWTKRMGLNTWALNRAVFSLLSQSWAYSKWGLQLHSHGLHALWAHLQSPHSGDEMRKVYPVSHQALHLHFNQKSSDILYNGALHTAVRWGELKWLSRVRLFATPWTVAYQAPLSMGFSRQYYWSGLPFPSPGDLDFQVTWRWRWRWGIPNYNLLCAYILQSKFSRRGMWVRVGSHFP